MSQYLEIKAANPGLLLFYRMGDFYELFFEDAQTASRALGIALTKRGKHLGEDIPMCGVPVRTADQYLLRLIKLGHRVAVCDQIEDPAVAKKRGAKAVVRREIVRLVTPGTLTEDELLDPRRSNYLLAIVRGRSESKYALAWVDISTGEFSTTVCDAAQLRFEFARLEPTEVILPESLVADSAIEGASSESKIAVSPLPDARFDSINGDERLRKYYNIATLDGFGGFSRSQIAAAGAILDYVSLTQVGKLPNIRPIRAIAEGGLLVIDAATRNNLEIVKTLDGQRSGSLLSTIDLTVTGAGGRLLASRISAPLVDISAINSRLDAVGFFFSAPSLRQRIQSLLREVPDIERVLARIALNRGGPRELDAVAKGLSLAMKVCECIAPVTGLAAIPPLVSLARESLGRDFSRLHEEISSALGPRLPALARDGGFIVDGYRKDLDGARNLRDHSQKVIAELQSSYSAKTGIKSLKVRHNNVLGYFVEIGQQHGAPMSSNSGEFIHRQTISNSMRFTTVELGNLEQKIAEAANTALAIELEIYESLLNSTKAIASQIAEAANALAELDVMCALAELAEKRNYVRPIVDEGTDFSVVGGRHPVVEASLEDGRFVANDCIFTAGENRRRIWLVTGPNMAGKSTFLRQQALIVLLAQMGSFVPAKQAQLGIVDRLFSRVGAADDLARGRSTFMMEMVETAAILNQATSRSLVILDEIGRGTSTFDGLSIAWASLEHLHNVNQCRTLFATHFHELTALAAKLEYLGNLTMKVKEWNDQIIFLHEIELGAADRSYGIHVARYAGLPMEVVTRANNILTLLEKGEQSTSRRQLIDDLPLFSSANAQIESPVKEDPIASYLAAIHPDHISPREALEAIYRLKSMMVKSQ